VLTGPNAIHPNRLTSEERLAEIGEILAAALIRGRKRFLTLPTGRTPPTKGAENLPPDGAGTSLEKKMCEVSNG